MSTNDLYNRIVALRAIRSFRDDPLTDEDLGKLLEAARWTGSSKNLQNWSFVVIDGIQKERLAECGNFTDPLRNAPVAIALVEERGGYEFDTGRVAQNLMLAADAIGVASCPITLHRDGDVAAVLGLPRGARCRYAVALGYPAAMAANWIVPGGGALGRLTQYVDASTVDAVSSATPLIAKDKSQGRDVFHYVFSIVIARPGSCSHDACYTRIFPTKRPRCTKQVGIYVNL